MAFDNDTNHGRVTKIVYLLDQIEKSAVSNTANKEQVSAMLKPANDKLSSMCVETVMAVREMKQDRKGAWGVTAPQWASVRDMAESASLDDLGVAVFIYIQRCEDERADRRGQ